MINDDKINLDGGADLAGTRWLLMTLDGEPPLAGTTITLDFNEGGKAGGSSGCNRFMTSYSFDAASGALSFGRSAGTMMACPPPVMAQEQRFLQALAATISCRIEGPAMTLLGSGEAVLAEFSYVSQSLAGTSWVVTGYNNGKVGVVSVIGGTSLTAVFAEDTLSGSSGCNSYSGSYTAAAGGIAFGPLAGTRKMCFDNEIMEQETRFLQALASAAVYHISGDRMEMRREDGALAVNLRCV